MLCPVLSELNMNGIGLTIKNTFKHSALINEINSKLSLELT